jgi:cytochrome c oxidase subunit 1
MLFISLVLFLSVIVATWLFGSRGSLDESRYTLPEPLSGPADSPLLLDRIGFWFGIAVLLVIVAYSVPLWSMLANGLFTPGSPPVIP